MEKFGADQVGLIRARATLTLDPRPRATLDPRSRWASGATPMRAPSLTLP